MFGPAAIPAEHELGRVARADYPNGHIVYCDCCLSERGVDALCEGSTCRRRRKHRDTGGLPSIAYTLDFR